jgi:Zn-dependent peptidase ImmA (M78 family)/transcriptional regulator with XRE-family HTH domain
MTKVPVNPLVLAWARKERGHTLEEAANLLGVAPHDLAKLENGAREPTVTELREIAAKYEIGFSSLLMPEPLAETTRLRVSDFRTRRSLPETWNPDLLAEMDDINVLVDALSDLREADPALVATRLPMATTRMNPAAVAAGERRRTGLTVESQNTWGTPAAAFRRFRSFVEEQGVFVYLIRASTVDDWRGLAIFDDRKVPIIVLNSDESEPGARSFSLFHEYAHILLRQSAISDQRSRSKTESFCNKFAAHFLMPGEKFKVAAIVIGHGYRDYWTDGQIRKLSNVFKTSMSAVAIHLENTEMAPDGFYKVKLGEWRLRQQSPKKRPVVPYYEQIANRLGNRHVDTVFDALDAGYLNQIDAYEMLDVQASNFAKLRSEINARRAAYGWR